MTAVTAIFTSQYDHLSSIIAENVHAINVEDFQPSHDQDSDQDQLEGEYDDGHYIRTPPFYEREDWIAHYDAMQPCFAALTERGPDPWKMHKNKHGGQPWWEPRWNTLAHGETQWTGCEDGLCERKSCRCNICYAIREDCETTTDKAATWCDHCECGCTSLETCISFPDHTHSRQLHVTSIKNVLDDITRR